MDNNSASLDEWRIFFKTANADIFGIIENAIMVAAMDYPNELKQKKSSITELLFTCKVTRCFGCNSVELALPNVYADEVEAMCKTNELNKEVETGKSNDTKPNGDGSDHFEMQLNANQMSNCSFGDAEALSDEIDQEFQTVTEVLRIKKILDNHGQEVYIFSLVSLNCSASLLFGIMRFLLIMLFRDEIQSVLIKYFLFFAQSILWILWSCLV